MSPRTDKQNKDIRQKMELQILNAALDLFASDGFEGTSMNPSLKKQVYQKAIFIIILKANRSC